MKCTHERIRLARSATARSVWVRNSGEWDYADVFTGYTGKVEVYCPDCEMNRIYRSRKPKWLLIILKEIEAERERIQPRSEREGIDAY
jgi:hypothetical protein